MNRAATPPKISVILPCWNDLSALSRSLDNFRALAGPDTLEIIVADATEDSAGRELAAVRGALVAHCPEPSRGRQMNQGAALATGDVLLFQHVDTQFTAGHLRALIKLCATRPEVVGGAFHRWFDERHPWLRWLQGLAALWSRTWGAFYGDQSIFVRRAHFHAMGGFADIPLMEDLDFCRRLRRSGTVTLLDPPIASSARRHLKRGAWRMSLQNGLFIILWHLGVSPHRLHAWYYAARPGTLVKTS